MIKILLVDDNIFVRDSLKALLNTHPDINVIGECTDGIEVIPYLQQNIVDVILMDYQMPLLNGVEATKLVKMSYPKIEVIGLSCNDDAVIINDFIANGASGFLSKYKVTKDSLMLEIIKSTTKNPNSYD